VLDPSQGLSGKTDSPESPPDKPHDKFAGLIPQVKAAFTSLEHADVEYLIIMIGATGKPDETIEARAHSTESLIHIKTRLDKYFDRLVEAYREAGL